MKHTNDNIFERPQKRQSFVGKLAVRTKSKIYNLHPYKTISKLFINPDTGTWKRFDQGESEAKARDIETGSVVSIDICDQDSVPKEDEPSSSRGRLGSTFREKINFSRIISPLHQHFVKNKQVSPKSGDKQMITNVSSSVIETDSNQEILLVSQRAKRLSECMSSIPPVECSDAAQGKPQSKWKSFFEAFEVEEMRSGQGFWRDWKSGVKNYWHIFTGETTAHGYKRTMAAHRSKLGRFLWVLAIIGVTSCVIALLYNTMYGQDRYAFSSSIRSQPVVQMAFPAVTVCNLAPYDYNRIEDTPLKNSYDEVRQFLRQVSGLEDPDNDNETVNVFQNYDTRELHYLMGWKLENFIRSCYWNEIKMNCSQVFVQSKTLTETCFTFNFDPNSMRVADRSGSVSGLGLLLDAGDGRQALNLRVASGLKVLLHEPMEFPNARENGVLISPGTTTYMSVAKMEYKFLPRPYKAYVTEYCKSSSGDAEDEVHQTPRYYNYTGYTSCVAGCRLQAILDKCGCVVFAKDPVIANVPYCTAEHYVKCYLPTLRETFMESKFHIDKCECALPCEKVEYTTQISSSAFPRTVEGVVFLDRYILSNSSLQDKEIMQNYVELKIFYKELFAHIEEHVPLYNWLTIFGNVGGQLGLFIGASVLTALEFLELFLVMIWLLVQAAYVHFRTKWRSGSKNIGQTWKETGLA